MSNPFRYFNSSPEVIRLVVMMYVRYPLSLRNVEDLLSSNWVEDKQKPAICSPCQSFKQTAQIRGLSQFPLPRAGKLRDRIS
jgi:hypothetical protein